MNVVARIARKEYTEMWRDGRFRWMTLVVGILLLASLAFGWKHFTRVQAQRDAGRQSMRRQWLEQAPKDPHSAAHYSIYAFKPLLPTSFFDRGVEPYVGEAVFLEAHWQNEFKYRPAQDATALQRLGELTAATVLQILLPLLIIATTFSAFAGEREQGTLRQVLSLGVKGRDLALGKFAGIAAALLLLLLPATLIGVSALMIASENGSFTASIPRMLLIGLSYLLYFGIFICVSLAVSARARQSRAALTVLLAFWVVNSLVAPKALSDIAKHLYPTPSFNEFWAGIKNDINNGINGHDPRDARREELKRQVLRQYGVETVEQLPVNFSGIALQASEEYGNRIFDRHYQQLWSTYERQNMVHQAGALFAPLTAVRSLSMGLAGTDFAHHRHFASAAENYRRMLNKAMNDELTYNSRTHDLSYVADRRLWERVPDFTYSAPDVSWALSNLGLSIAVLSLWFTASAIALLIATRRIRV